MSIDEHKTLHDYAIAKLLAHPIESLAPYDRLRIANSIGSPRASAATTRTPPRRSWLPTQF
jgi:hypothetical protein